jgi:hypothetical protein
LRGELLRRLQFAETWGRIPRDLTTESRMSALPNA